MEDYLELDLKDNSGISCIRFNQTHPNFVAMSKWNGNLDIYDLSKNQLINSFTQKSPQLCCCFAENICVGGGADGSVSFNGVVIGKHNKAVSSIVYCKGTKTIVTSSFDETIKLWDLQGKLLKTLTLENKIYSMSNIDEYTVFCGCGEQTIVTFNTQDPDSGKSVPSPLAYNISCVAASQKNIAIGSFEGRICVEDMKKHSNFSFKAHNHIVNDIREIYSINAMKFNPRTNELITAGGDGKVYIWDIPNRKVACDAGPFDTSISSIDITKDGRYLVIAISYGFENGDIDHAPDQVKVFKLK